MNSRDRNSLVVHLKTRRKVDADPLLFEGRLLLDALSVAAVDYHVKPVVRAKLGT